MRIFAAVLALALAVLPAEIGNAAASRQAADCPHQSAVPAETDHHGRPSTAPAGPAACCILLCVAFAAAPAGFTPENSGTGTVARVADERFAGTDIEPAIPPPRG